MVFRSTEVKFFEDEKKVQEIISAWKSSNHDLIQYYRGIYARSLPRAALDEILIEKSPQYIGQNVGTGWVEPTDRNSWSIDRLGGQFIPEGQINWFKIKHLQCEL